MKQTKSQKEQEAFEKEEAEKKARMEEAKKNGTLHRMMSFLSSVSEYTHMAPSRKDFRGCELCQWVHPHGPKSAPSRYNYRGCELSQWVHPRGPK